jgi:hypothetical protein
MVDGPFGPVFNVAIPAVTVLDAVVCTTPGQLLTVAKRL